MVVPGQPVEVVSRVGPDQQVVLVCRCGRGVGVAQVAGAVAVVIGLIRVGHLGAQIHRIIDQVAIGVGRQGHGGLDHHQHHHDRQHHQRTAHLGSLAPPVGCRSDSGEHIGVPGPTG